MCVGLQKQAVVFFIVCQFVALKKPDEIKNVQYISSSCISLILLRCLKRITFANVYDIHLVINMTEVVLHGLGFA